MNPAISPRHRRYLRDPDVLHAGLVSLLVLLLSGGLVWLAYLIHVCRIAARSPLVPPRRMVTLVFGRRLQGGRPEHDYRQRLQRALALVQGARIDHLLLLGGCGAGQCSEAAVGKAWLLQHGLPRQIRVELEQDSTDSLENLRHARCLLQAGTEHAEPPPVALVTSRYHLARCLLLARRLGFDGVPVAAEATLPLRPGYLGQLLTEASYLMWIDLGMRWAGLIGHRRMAARIS
ncbi:MAG: YdcF family protein [Rhodanobacter sp.]|nr:MAG: YdcF family protein [Rhodanobacter sp.]TAM05814.1 MAG: YdcF family protein [Rhodanobacter sp.]TAM38617.1 MAG: YdcF family protein [Rhodanobacter sp.]TAN23642.1 MAG: YdcF family protein [Rhodanobacter sp.]